MRTAIPLIISLLCLNGFSPHPSNGLLRPVSLPSRLIDGRFYIKIPTPNGDTLLGFCDTGGGYNAVYPTAITRLHLEGKVLETAIDSEKIRYIPAKDVIADPNIPAPRLRATFLPYIKVPFFQVPAPSEEGEIINAYIPHDVFLGQFFFIDHAWTFDYENGRIYVNTPLYRNAKNKNIQPLGFKKDKEGHKLFGHPSMQVEIDGQLIDVLFDTGASILLSNKTQTELLSSSKSIAGSFIAKSIFDQWHTRHPDWRFIEQGEVTRADMIQVPQIKIGNTTAGPVWFAKRPDEAWSKGMITSMDKVVKGAVGGSLFQYYKVTIDYNSELARFEKND
jgi:hypothetical protein